jgi:hypothetical protein
VERQLAAHAKIGPPVQAVEDDREPVVDRHIETLRMLEAGSFTMIEGHDGVPCSH